MRRRSLFGSLFASSRREDYLASYVIRECSAGRPLAEVLDDAYIRNRTTPEQRARLLERPDVVAGVGAQATQDLRHALVSVRRS
jgi:hypothetical protein